MGYMGYDSAGGKKLSQFIFNCLLSTRAVLLTDRQHQEPDLTISVLGYENGYRWVYENNDDEMV